MLVYLDFSMQRLLTSNQISLFIIDDKLISEFRVITAKSRQQFHNVLNNPDEFKFESVKSTTYTFTVNNEHILQIPFKLAKCKPVTNESSIWKQETIVPGAPETFLEYSNTVNKWDTTTASCQVVELFKDENTRLCVINRETNSLGNGLIKPRQITNIAEVRKIGENQFECTAQSIDCSHFPTKDGVIQGEQKLFGSIITVIDHKELKQQYQIPEIDLVEDDGTMDILKWCKVVSVFQIDLKGWIPKFVLENTMATSLAKNFQGRIKNGLTVCGADVN
eukprot:347528_1